MCRRISGLEDRSLIIAECRSFVPMYAFSMASWASTATIKSGCIWCFKRTGRAASTASRVHLFSVSLEILSRKDSVLCPAPKTIKGLEKKGEEQGTLLEAGMSLRFLKKFLQKSLPSFTRVMRFFQKEAT